MGDIYHAGEVYAGSVPIDDTQASEDKVYSSAKVESIVDEIEGELSDKKGEVKTWTFTTTGSISANSSTGITFPSQTLPEGYGLIGFIEGHTNNNSVIGILFATGGASGRTYTPQYIYRNLSSSNLNNITFYLTALIQKN
jgi:hypothetical protein